MVIVRRDFLEQSEIVISGFELGASLRLDIEIAVA